MHFSGVHALSGVSLEINEGEIFSLIGPNGSGKSTLFNCINRFCVPRSGKIYFNNIELTQLAPHDINSIGISRTFQNLQNIPYMSLLDNVMLGMHTRITTKDMVRRWYQRKERYREEAMALEIMDFLGIANFESKYLSGQPYGIQKLVEIARALVSNPKLILLDEPAAGMNDQETLEVARIVTEIRDKLGITVLAVEHDMKFVMDISNRVGVLDSGKIITIGSPREVKKDPKVLEAYLGEGFDA